jgi:long-chain alkane monooxygenase
MARAATQNLGLLPTLSVSEYPPYLLARLINSLDHVTEGRIDWNCVTGNDGTAQNHGHDKHRPQDERYEVADEFADVVTRLWEAWEPDAVVLDRDKPMFADGSKVHPINHDGKYFKLRGPINAHAPWKSQAGGSPAGKKFASKWADTIITEGSDIQRMRSIARRCAPTPPRSTAIRTTSKLLFCARRSSTRRWRRRSSGAGCSKKTR